MKKKRYIMALDILIFLIIILAGVYLYLNEYSIALVSVFGLAALCGLVYIIITHVQIPHKSSISKVTLLNDEDKPQKEWYLKGQQGMLIGKSNRNHTADIDLSETEYAVLVAEDHAIINCVKGKWYLEDLGSRNGTGVKTKGEDKVRRLSQEDIVEVEAGYRIYIAKSILELH